MSDFIIGLCVVIMFFSIIELFESIGENIENHYVNKYFRFKRIFLNIGAILACIMVLLILRLW